MQRTILDDYVSLSSHAAEIILEVVRKKPDALLCLAAGETPVGTYASVVQLAQERQIDFTQANFIGLDEWIGIPPDNPGSCQYFLRTNLLTPLNIRDNHIHFFNSLSGNLADECNRIDSVISKAKGLDLILVGVGMNGHIGFNEPGTSSDLYCHVIDLDDTTRKVGQKYFKEKTTLQKGITVGLKHLLEARTVIMIASGSKKADVMRIALQEDISETMPASIVRKHPGSIVLLDKDAAHKLSDAQA